MMTVKGIGITIGLILFIGLIAYFRYVGTFGSLLTREQSGAVTEQEKKIADLETKISEATREKDAAIRRQREAERRFDAAMATVSEERRKVREWAAKYAEIKDRPRSRIESPAEADKALREMGW